MISAGDFNSKVDEPIGGKVAVAVRQRLEARRREVVDLLGELVEIESASDDPSGLAEMGSRLEDLMGRFGPVVRHRAGADNVHHLALTVESADSKGLSPTVVLGHYDTVWPRGTLKRIPFAVDERGVATGPGCFDMKGGLVLLYYALRELEAIECRPRRPIRIVLNADEEVGSRTSRELIANAAADAAAALVLESPLPGGTLKTARKGSALYRIKITGRAAHAGVEPEKGTSAVVELAHQVLALHALNDYARGTSVNVGIVSGGSRVNVVPAEAEALVNARTTTAEEADRTRQAIEALRPTLTDSGVDVVVGLSRPPMPRTAAIGQLFTRARRIASEMGIADLKEGSTGGGSDGNLVAAMGVPTLDGLGPEGGGAHADDEHVLVESMPRRAALLAGLLAEI
jgi:glutamate carboxypeptidase